MKSINFKKITSFFLLFFLFFSFTIRVPLELFFSYTAFAWDKEFFNLVSIIVDEESYDESDLRSKLIRYSRDVQLNLENTRVVILPTPSDASALDIASLNESLFYEWYKAHRDVDFESRLVWTVLVWNIPLPVVFDDGNSGKSILPYVDFEDKAYIFNHQSWKYEKNDFSSSELTPEIWHWVISPNTGTQAWNIVAINDYLDKNHDFYSGEWVFDQELWVIDGQDTDAPLDYEPYVFYYDQFRENEALQYQSYVWYQMYLQNIEDITYNRYSKELAEKVKDQVLGVQNADIQDLLIEVDPDFDMSGFWDGPDSSSSSDVLTRYITDNATKKFLEIFNGSTLWEMRKHVYNAGRYNQWGSAVNMDMPPFLISVLDQVSSEVIKNVNTELENNITDLVANGLSKKIAIPLEDIRLNGPTTCNSTYRGFYYGTISNDIESAAQCSIYRWNTNGWTLVEANRWFNVNLTEDDLNLCRWDFSRGDTDARQATQWYWGGNSPLNFDIPEDGSYEDIDLKYNDLDAGIHPVYDILGSKEINDSTKNPSPLDCFTEGVLIKTYQQRSYRDCQSDGEWWQDCEDKCGWTTFQAPVLWKTSEWTWSCRTENIQLGLWDFVTNYNSFGASISTVPDGWTCTNTSLILDGSSVKSQTQSCTWGGEDGCTCISETKNLTYKTIPSHILHTSPTDEEFGAQVQSLFTPSLPIDSDRYIDFIGANGWDRADQWYERIDFPQLFRVTVDTGEDLTIENIEAKVKNHLDAVSSQINTSISNSKISWTPSSLFNTHFKTGDFPEADIDLYSFLKDKPLEIFTSDNQSKEISYFDTLVFSVYWNNLNTVSSKYKFIFENYLGNQFEGNDYGFHLPKSKKLYETTYLSAPWDAQNMYVKLDPEQKGVHPYADILAQNIALNNTIAAANVWELENQEWTFECAPPDGVNIFQWIPAVICWLKNMLPPTIKITDGSCWVSEFTDEQKEEIAECSVDLNGNGIIDCLEEKLSSWSLLLYSDAVRYYYHSPGVITTEIYDNDGDIAFFDSNSYVKHELIRLEVPENSDEVFNASNTTVIYDKNDNSRNSDENYANAQKYIAFQTTSPRALRWKSSAYFYGKWRDTNAYFESSLVINDVNWSPVVDLESEVLRVEVRGDRLLMWSFRIEDNTGDYYAGSEVRVSDSDNICIADGSNKSLSDLADETYGISEAEEKLLLLVENISQAWNKLDLAYPIDIELKREGLTVFEQKNIWAGWLDTVQWLFAAQKSGIYELYVTDNYGSKTYKRLDILADIATDLDIILGSNVVETWWNISTHFFTITDKFENPASGELYIVDAEISGDGLVFEENGENSISYTIGEWYKAFRLKSTEDTWLANLSFSLKDLSGNIIQTQQSQIEVVDDILIDITALSWQAKVGGEQYDYKVRFTNESWDTYENLSSRVYLVVESLYWNSTSSYSEVVDWEAEISFKTSDLAGENIFLEFQLEWGNEIYKEYIDIHPDFPIKIDLNLSKSKMEASSSDTSILQATLKDRYNNDVYTDNTTVLIAEVADQSSGIISFDASTQTVQKWKTQFQIRGTDIPGIWFFKVESNPDLSENSFDLIWQAPFEKELLLIPTMTDASWELTGTWKKFYKTFSSSKFISLFITKELLLQSEAYENLPSSLKQQVEDFWDETNKLTVSGLGVNAWSVETFFFWWWDDINDSAYNWLYSVLLWAEYGDISQEGYLAGELLFQRDNSALSVTSLLNNPYTFHDTVSISPTWWVDILNSWDITQDISVISDIDDDGRLFISLYNSALETYIWKTYYNLSSTDNIDISLVDDNQYTQSQIWDTRYIKSPEGQVIFELQDVGRFSRKQWSYLTLNQDYNWEWILFDIHHNTRVVWSVLIAWSFDINITRDTDLLQNKLELLNDTIVVHISSNSYSSRKSFSADWTNELTKLYYHDPFAAKNKLNSLHNTSWVGLESSYDESGIWWQDPNIMLLSFSSGESVWDATQNFQSFSMINLWDPVISLKRLSDYFPGTSDEKSFDSTLWEIINDDEGLIWFQVFDYNNDTRKDIITIHTDWYIALHEWSKLENNFIKQRNLVYAADGWSVRLVKTGDFTGDGFGDIFFVSEDGIAEMFNNHEKDFFRYDIAQQLSLSGSIIQADTFDMDADGRDDIVTLDDAWEIHIFYGWGSSQSPLFTKKFVWDGYAIELQSESQSFGGAVYFDGLTQIDSNDQSRLLEMTQEYLDWVSQAIEDKDEDAIPDTEFINDSLINTLIYVEIPYSPTDYEAPLTNQEELLEWFEQQTQSLWPEAQAQWVWESNSALSDFIANYDSYIDYSGFWNVRNTSSFFLRSQYADSEGLEISKTFTDTSLPNLQTWDRVYYDITIKNTSSERKNNIAYVDSIPKYFKFVDDQFIVLSEDNTSYTRKPGIGWYNILLDWFFLDPGEETVVRYELETLPLSYGHLQVWLYETWEVWDDIYGDIILKEDDKNCWTEAKIYRSTAVRSYLEWITNPVCDESQVDIGNTFPQLTDDNNNGVPDYLDDLLEAESLGDESAIQDYSVEALDSLLEDTDNDGIPDQDDSLDNTHSAENFMWAIDAMNEAIDDIAADIDQLIEWFSCGFWGGSCFANPLNWAPLAPWNDPTLFGMPIWNGLRVNEWFPVFSALTWRQTSCGTSPCCLPSVFPANSATFIPWPVCGWPGAGWSRWVTSPTNFVRMFVTPTLTGWAGIAVCFWAPAIVRWNLPPPGVNPVVPGGNCIVAAMPLFGCEWGEWDPSGLGYPVVWDFWVIHANCDGWVGQELVSPRELSEDFITDYFEYLESGEMPAGLYESYLESFAEVESYGGAGYTMQSGPLINIGWWEWMMSTSVDLDISALTNWDFEDVVDINNKRIGWFPNFLMDWVERQLDEVTSKLTNLPKIFVILPDFWGIFDGGFENFWEGLSDAFNEWKTQREEDRNERSASQDALRSSKDSLDCAWADALQCAKINLSLAAQGWQNFKNNTNERLSGIKQVYEFVWNIPLVNIETQTVSINVPWIDQSELNRFSADWKLTAEQWKNELKQAETNWSFGWNCEGTAQEISDCQEQNDIRKNASLEASAFISSLERNIEILEEYKKFPEKLSKLLNIKEEILYVVLCNIDAIAKLMWEWINTNWERFKAWVELYLLIKAILKSWQLFIDVFNGYDAECHECKNERQDLQNFTFQLISAVIPSPPIIQFPKWPDIILDFHNIRAGITIDLPDFEMNLRPIVLPTLPDLKLPAVPTASFSLPELPVLPMFEIPELPEIPSIPSIELPDLPPPPKIPKLFWAVDAVLNIAKLVTKAMCILKQSPFVPEWRAWDQIAFLTERNGYLPTDMIDIQPPAFSYSTYSAIKVTTYVNLEFETEFIVEAVRAITAPIDNITNNIASMFDMQISNIDFSKVVPEELDVDLELDWIEADVSLKPLDKNPDGIYMIAWLLASGFLWFLDTISKDEGILYSNKEFISHINSQLANPEIVSDSKTRELLAVWDEVNNMSYSKEDAFIHDLKEHNEDKFDTLKSIITTEMEHSEKQRKALENISSRDEYIEVSQEIDFRVEEYNALLEPYNIRTVEAATALLSWESEEAKSFQTDLDVAAKDLMKEVSWGLQSYRNNLLAAEWDSGADTASNSCIGTGAYEYRYEWIYVLEDGKNYKLFDYTDILRGDEQPYVSDIDNDGDEDVLFLTRWKLFLKENYKESEETQHISWPPLILQSDDNKFFNGEVYYEAINWFEESWVSDGAINIQFDAPTNTALKNFQLTYHTTVDKYLDESRSFLPLTNKTHIVDALAYIDDRDILEQEDDYAIQQHVATLWYAGAISWATLTTEKLINIRDELNANRQVILTSGTSIYAWNTDFSIRYKLWSGDEQEVSVRKFQEISFNSPAEIVSLNGDAYISLWILQDIQDTDIIDYIGKPILPWASIGFDGNPALLDESSHIDIRYYDGTKTLIDIREIESYTLYDLWSYGSESYNIRLKVPNDFYYARINAFSEIIDSTYSQQILLAPQVYNDSLAPQIWLNQKIRIPVYQTQTVDLTPYIYEDGGLAWISDIKVDFDLSLDSDGDGDPKNDRDIDGIDIEKTAISIKISFWPYDSIFEKDINLLLEDDNGNIWSREVVFEVYPPNPSIEEIEWNVISWAIDETLLDEPVRLYRYRWGIIEKLQWADGDDIIETDISWNYSFETPETSTGLALSYSGITLATVDEYTWRIDFEPTALFMSTRVLASNDPLNTSVFPEIQIMRTGVPIFRQYVVLPGWWAQLVSNFENLEEAWVYVRMINQEEYGSYRIPLGVSYNPWSISVYQNSDEDKSAIMTIFSDGRVHINDDAYSLEYRTHWDNMSLVLVQRDTWEDITQLFYQMDASYILN